MDYYHCSLRLNTKTYILEIQKTIEVYSASWHQQHEGQHQRIHLSKGN